MSVVGEIMDFELDSEIRELMAQIAPNTGHTIEIVPRTLLADFPEGISTFATPADTVAIRKEAAARARLLGINHHRVNDFELAVAEAATNAIKYGGPAPYSYGIAVNGNRLVCRIQDNGPGITDAHTAFTTGVSSLKTSAGCGFRLMEASASRVIVVTDALGTIVQLELDL